MRVAPGTILAAAALMSVLAIVPPMRADGAASVAKPSLQDVSEGLACQCGWSGEFVGLTAVHHWVEPWEQVIGGTASG